MAEAFSVGFDFNYYGPEYGNRLVVKPRYKDLKEEIFHYKYINVKQYYHVILPKAEIYHKTKVVKAMKPSWKELDGLICIILYTSRISTQSTKLRI